MLEFIKYYLMYEAFQLVGAILFIAVAIGLIFLWGWIERKRGKKDE